MLSDLTKQSVLLPDHYMGLPDSMRMVRAQAHDTDQLGHEQEADAAKAALAAEAGQGAAFLEKCYALRTQRFTP